MNFATVLLAVYLNRSSFRRTINWQTSLPRASAPLPIVTSSRLFSLSLPLLLLSLTVVRSHHVLAAQEGASKGTFPLRAKVPSNRDSRSVPQVSTWSFLSWAEITHLNSTPDDLSVWSAGRFASPCPYRLQ